MKKRSKGFTIVELLIVIVVVAILASISVAAFNGVQAKSRDAKKRADVASLARALEAHYAINGSYPPFSQPTDIGLNSAIWRGANMPGLPDATLTPPGASGVSLVNTATPTATQYGYRNGGGCLQCPRFFLYWKSDVTSQVETVLSLYGQ